jgi:glutathione S-transferase
MATPKLKLTYFDFHGGRGEVARLAMHIGAVAFEDERVKPSDWPARKASTPFGGMPVLEIDGQLVAQCNGINRFTGKLAKLYPDDPLQAAFCDEAMDAVEDISSQVGATMWITDDEEKQRRRKALVDGPIPFYLRALASRLAQRGGVWFADGRLTVADLKVFLWIRHLKSGHLDHIPADLTDQVAPSLVEHFERVKNHPAVKAYYAARGVS